MSLYNMLHGYNPLTPLILGMIGKTHTDFARYRDCYIKNGRIIVHTRLGGGNRPDYIEEWQEMRADPLYITDEDDDFDYTYANIEYQIPAEYVEFCKHLEDVSDRPPPKEMWKKTLADLQNGKRTPGTEAALEIGKKISKLMEEG